MASFTGVGDSVSLSLQAKGETVDIAISGTYDMTILFQIEEGSPGSGSWQTLTTYSTANATVADQYITEKTNENLRLIVNVDTSGTATATLTSTSDLQVFARTDDFGNSVSTYTQAGVTFPGTVAVAGATSFTGGTTFDGDIPGPRGPTDITTTPITVTAASHANRVLTVNKADGVTFTLPAATGTGNTYKFFVGTTITSVGLVVQAANSSDTMSGVAFIAQDGADTVVCFETASTSDTVTLNGTTTGGIIGDFLEFIDVATNKFYVRCTMSGTGVEATPFSAAV